MNQQEALQQLSRVDNKANMGVAAIYFTDNERHIAQIWSIAASSTHLEYRDVHTDPHSNPIRTEYRYIDRIEDYMAAND